MQAFGALSVHNGIRRAELLQCFFIKRKQGLQVFPAFAERVGLPGQIGLAEQVKIGAARLHLLRYKWIVFAIFPQMPDVQHRQIGVAEQPFRFLVLVPVFPGNLSAGDCGQVLLCIWPAKELQVGTRKFGRPIACKMRGQRCRERGFSG